MNTIEHRIVSQLLAAALPLGYTTSVWDGEEWTLRKSTDPGEIIQALATTSDDLISFRDADNQYVGTFWLIYGNNEDLISDHSDNPLTEALYRAATQGIQE
jgi:hypothetical protein